MLKYLTPLFLVLGLLTFPFQSHARNVETDINVFVGWYEADDECAVETEFKAFVGGGFITGFEGLYVDGVEWGNLNNLPTSGYSVGDKISWGTEALEIKLQYTFDVRLKAEICRDLKLGASITYRGSDGVDISEFKYEEEPSLNMSATFDKGLGTYSYWDLSMDRITLTGLNGDSISFGGGAQPSTGGSTGGCALGSLMGSGASLPTFLTLGLFLGLWSLRRFKK